MKKTALLLLLTAALLFVGCEPESTEAYIPTVSTTETTESSTTDTAPTDVEFYQPKSYENRYIAIDAHSYCALKIQSPKDWEIVGSSGNYDIKRNGEKIGNLTYATPLDLGKDWTVFKEEKRDSANHSKHYFLEYKTENGTKIFRHRFYYSYTDLDKDSSFHLTLNYTEVSDFTFAKLFSSAEVVSLRTDPNFGILSSSPKNRILMLGNSFIGSSQVGTILQEMLNNDGKNIHVTAISRGYATVNTYINDSAMMQDIQNGVYDMIFICGFYSSNEVQNLSVLKKACAKSNTTLIIFPAHNENEGVVSSASSANSDLILLNWKKEVQSLINTGLNQWDFCVNDQHKHSTPLAGYVGAHMIYRALYGAAPQRGVSDTISQSYVDSILGNYSKTGTIDLVKNGILTLS